MEIPSQDRALRPQLHYLEYHLTEHCNLDCAGCGHFSPFASEAYADPDAFARDLDRLSQLFSNVRKICLLGGEPLLHPEPEAFLKAARARFPDTILRIVTNGIMLKKIGDSFWQGCRDTATHIDLSLYPALAKSRETFERICRDQQVPCEIRQVDNFYVGINPRGDSDPAKAMEYCRSHSIARSCIIPDFTSAPCRRWRTTTTSTSTGNWPLHPGSTYSRKA